MLSTKKKRDEGVGVLGSATAYMRSVIVRQLPFDREAVQVELEDMRRNYETPAQRQEIEARERRLAAEKAAHQAPPPPLSRR